MLKMIMTMLGLLALAAAMPASVNTHPNNNNNNNANSQLFFNVFSPAKPSSFACPPKSFDAATLLQAHVFSLHVTGMVNGSAVFAPVPDFHQLAPSPTQYYAVFDTTVTNATTNATVTTTHVMFGCSCTNSSLAPPCADGKAPSCAVASPMDAATCVKSGALYYHLLPSTGCVFGAQPLPIANNDTLVDISYGQRAGCIADAAGDDKIIVQPLQANTGACYSDPPYNVTYDGSSGMFQNCTNGYTLDFNVNVCESTTPPHSKAQRSYIISDMLPCNPFQPFSPHKHPSNVGVIVGATLGGLAGLCLLIGVIYYANRKQPQGYHTIN